MIERLAARLRARRPPASPWASVIETSGDVQREPPNGLRVLCATSVGSHPLARVVNGLVGMALWLRGTEVELLLCDGTLPACEVCSYGDFPDPTEFVERGPQPRLCRPCFGAGVSHYEPLPLPLLRYSRYVAAAEREQVLAQTIDWTLQTCFTFDEDGLRLGEQVRAALLRFFGKADLSSEPEDLVLATARRYAAGALVAARVAERLLEHLRPDVLVAHHGVYVPQGVLGEVARRRGVRVVNWGAAYRDRTIIVSHDDTYHRTFLTEPTDTWSDRPLDAAQEAQLMEYLGQRRLGRGDWSWVTPDAALRPTMQEREHLIAELELDSDLPTFGLLTNVLWDAQLYYAGHAFDDMLDWLWTTIDHFVERDDRQLLVRVHPHEVKQGNRQPVGPEIATRYATLPRNIRVIPYDHPYNTYALMDLCDAVLIYGTKTGVELAPFGVPVVVAGDAWIRGKGLTHDVATREEYRRLLDRLSELEPLDEATTARARQYAYHYFFRRSIPLASLDADAGEPTLRISSLDDLRAGSDPGLDVVCRGVLDGAPFEYDGG
jgi:hypothetical protein